MFHRMSVTGPAIGQPDAPSPVRRRRTFPCRAPWCGPAPPEASDAHMVLRCAFAWGVTCFHKGGRGVACPCFRFPVRSPIFRRPHGLLVAWAVALSRMWRARARADVAKALRRSSPRGETLGPERARSFRASARRNFVGAGRRGWAAGPFPAWETGPRRRPGASSRAAPPRTPMRRRA